MPGLGSTMPSVSIPPTQCGPLTLQWGRRTYVMGVVNVTPDSFSNDGLSADPQAALEQALRMEEEGADIIDVGGESTRRYDDRQGAVPVSAEEELRRALPVVELLAQSIRAPVSIDTYKPEVARRCVDAGAAMINDVWGVASNPEMLRTAAETDVPYVLMHNRRGHQYGDVMAEIVSDLDSAMLIAVESGVSLENIIVDPGIGFGKAADQSLELEGKLSELTSLKRPILVGPSRKSHIGLALGGLPVEERLEGTAAAVALCIAGGADIVRVHDVKEMVRVARMSDAIVRGWRPEGWPA